LPGSGRHTQRLENAIGNQNRIDLLRLPESRNASRPRLPHAHGLECAIMRREGEIHRGRQAQFIAEVGQPWRTGSVQTHCNQLLRLRIRQRPDQHAVEHTEHGCIRPDANGQRCHHRDREPRRSPHFTAPLTEQGHIAEVATRGSFGHITRHAVFHQFLDAFVDVFLDGDRDVVIPAISEEEATEP
jgi:hypothetical protein